jgi:hypothetical protein
MEWQENWKKSNLSSGQDAVKKIQSPNPMSSERRRDHLVVSSFRPILLYRWDEL